MEYDGLDDYPDFILPAAKYISEHKLIGIIFGGSGQGEAMAANRIKELELQYFIMAQMKLLNYLAYIIMQIFYLLEQDL